MCVSMRSHVLSLEVSRERREMLEPVESQVGDPPSIRPIC